MHSSNLLNPSELEGSVLAQKKKKKLNEMLFTDQNHVVQFSSYGMHLLVADMEPRTHSALSYAEVRNIIFYFFPSCC